MRQLYKLIPRFIKTRIYKAVAHRVATNEKRSLEKVEEVHPKIELKSEHIKNLKILTNKPALLDVLPKHAIAAEIGVSRGDYSEKILSVTQPKKLHLIDAWTYEGYQGLGRIVKNRFENEIKLGRVLIHEGRSTTELENFTDGYFDWVYIDTSHEYENTAVELEISRRKVKIGGIIAGHDYVMGHWPTKTRYGVIEAVHEFCVKYNWEMIYLTCENHQHRSFALTQISI